MIVSVLLAGGAVVEGTPLSQPLNTSILWRSLRCDHPYETTYDCDMRNVNEGSCTSDNLAGLRCAVLRKYM